jgi:hypothetical protein
MSLDRIETKDERAFPHGGFSQEGMSLRDYFAAQSISAFALDMSDPDITFDDVAQNAYRLADAMLNAREAKND